MFRAMAGVTFDDDYTQDDYQGQIQLDFSLRAATYDQGPNGAMHVDLVQTLLSHYPAQYPVLDIACGTGLLAAALGRSGEGVTGVDLTAEMLSQARASSPRGTFVEGRAEALPFADGTFGSAYICAALVYLTDVDAALRETHRVLRGGGHVAYQAVTLDSYVVGVVLQQALRDVLGTERADRTWRLPHALTDTEEANVGLLERAGFEEVQAEKVTVWSDLEVGEIEERWERLGRNALLRPIMRVKGEERDRLRERFVQLLEARRREDGTVQEMVTSWYVKGVKRGAG